MNRSENNVAWDFHAAVRARPEACAIVHGSRTVSYADLRRSSRRCSRVLRDAGIRPGDRVLLVLPNIPEFVAAYFGVLQIGAVVVSINPALKAEEVERIVANCSPTAAIVVADESGAAPAPLLAGVRAIGLGDAFGAADAEDADADAVSAVANDDPAAIVYTSGTSGKPYGATLSHANIRFNTRSKLKYMGVTPADRLLLFVPLFHCFGQNGIMNAAIGAGATLVMERKFDPATIVDVVQRQKVSMFFGTPSAYRLLGKTARPEALASVRYYFSAAETLPVALAKFWQEKFGQVIHQGYGLTETSPFAAYSHIGESRTGSIGRPIDSVEMSVADTDTGALADRSAEGEIVIRGPNVMLGYWNNPERTAEVMRNGWLYTGDVGRIDRDGYITLVDRIKDMINVGGMKVFPTEIERALCSHDAVADAAVFGVPDPDFGEQVSAAVVLKPGLAVPESELVWHLVSRVSGYKIPREFAFLAELPRSPSGKLLRRELRDRRREEGPRTSAATLGRAFAQLPTEQRASAILSYCREVVAAELKIGLAVLGNEDPLIVLGADSLAAVRVARRLSAELGVEVATADVLPGSISTIAAGVDAALAGGAAVVGADA